MTTWGAQESLAQEQQHSSTVPPPCPWSPVRAWPCLCAVAAEGRGGILQRAWNCPAEGASHQSSEYSGVFPPVLLPHNSPRLCVSVSVSPSSLSPTSVPLSHTHRSTFKLRKSPSNRSYLHWFLSFPKCFCPCYASSLLPTTPLKGRYFLPPWIGRRNLKYGQ